MNFVLILITFFIVANAHSKDQICSSVVVHGTHDLKITDTEKRLVCGDKASEGYKVIPPYQAAYFMTGFLQSRGYLNPRFEMVGEKLNVHVGKLAKLKKVRLKVDKTNKDKKFIKNEITRRYKRKVLTPNLMDSMESETLSFYRQRGFPCTKVKSTLNAKTKEIDLDVTKTVYHQFGEYKREHISGLYERALDRYYPFVPKQKFNGRLLTLTEKRMMRAEVVQGTYFVEECSDDAKKFSMSQNFIIGPPRTLRFGAGASTELGPMGRILWSHNRFGSMASILSARLQGSFRSQSIILSTDSFFWKHKPRRSILSQFEVIRDSQIEYEQSQIKIEPTTFKWTDDQGGHHWTWKIGPGFEAGTYLSQSKTDTKSYKTGVIEGSLQSMAHNYEFFDIHPMEGDDLKFSFGFRDPRLGFNDRSLRLDSSYVKLNRLAELGRGTLVGGFRLNAGTLWITDKATLDGLPPYVKFYGGGSDDVRGFALNTLPENDGAGALTKLGVKLELRRTYFLIDSMEIFTFLDTAYFGDKSFTVSSDLFYSPGVGSRWLSPIGMVEAFVAQGRSSTEVEGNLYYVGFGGTF